MQRRILVVNLHPARVTLCTGLAQAYVDGAGQAGHQLRAMHLSDIAFDPDFGQSSFRNGPPLEDDLLQFQENLLWAQHLVFVTPLW